MQEQFQFLLYQAAEEDVSVNEFLAFRRYEVLKDHGRRSALEARQKAEAEYDTLNRTQPILSDFDRDLRKLLKKQGE